MKYNVLSPEEFEEFKKTATRQEIIERIYDLVMELGRVTDTAPETVLNKAIQRVLA